MSDQSWELFYWASMKEKDGKLRNHMIGRGEFVRLMFELAAVPYLDHGVQENGGATVFKFARGGENAGFPVFAPPIIKRGEFVLSQTPAIMKYLGKEFGFFTTNNEDEAHADSMMAFLTDFIAEGRLVFHSKGFTKSYYEQVEEVKPTVHWFQTERLPQFLKYLNSVLDFNAKLHPEGYLIGNSLTYVDVALFHVLEAAASQFPEDYSTTVAALPLLSAHRARIAAIPNIAAYLASDRRGFFEGNSMM
jgi:glutathione S-transferase